MREVARAAGVSVSTVANVLSRPSIVAPETRRRVEAAIEGVGYVPNGPARQLRGVPSPIVGSVTLDLANPFYAEVNRGIEDRLTEDGCLILACSTDLRAAKERELLKLLQTQAVRGIIISPIGTDPQPLLRLSRHGIPVVLLDHPSGGLELCAVVVDDVAGGRLAGEHLLTLGHRRIAFLGGTVDAEAVARRRDGVREALVAAGLDPAVALLDVRVPLHPPPLVEAAASAAALILDAVPPVTATVCLNDLAALGLLDGLAAAGVRVPADMSVVGYDDLSFARRLAPALTTVWRPKYQLGRAAAELLLDEAGPEHTHREEWFGPSLAVRASTGPPPLRPSKRID
ncbi:LacI family DNA-binding transcriptional regulator [Micromonospora sp. NBC_01813]|uniref:LacI family DNA-binding transcriptional regulator n=1 Tax=Micromonospora sp. NBC_01813 TaxID=2975988 RepID=UPI002DDB1541|nr:LacI family DNA-binding transcriptional regulator [Micromonospora sp. NBC_01813]WSA08635.1 LacI family transcriptional regulator [Micromonospora sp. NBC_01813]